MAPLELSASHRGCGLRLTWQFPLLISFPRPATRNPRNPAGVRLFRATQADRSNTLDREVVARRSDTNDILVAINPHLCECAQVRLTWSGKTEMNPEVPKMELEATFQDWIQNRMLPDHEAYRSGPDE